MMTDLDNPTALQSIVGDESQARSMVDDLAELPLDDGNEWEVVLVMDSDDVPIVQDELRELIPDDEGE